MRKLITLALFFVSSFSIVSAQDGASIYATYCAGCHGAQLQGGAHTALIKTEWKYGRGKGDMHKNIKFGIAGTEMVAWGKTLSDDQIDAVTDYVVTSQTTPPEAKRPIPSTLSTKGYQIKVEQLVTSGLESPWGIEFIDADHALISEHSGGIRWMIEGKLDTRSVTGVPATYTMGTTSGYFDIALDPKYKQNGWIYLAYSHTNAAAPDKDSPAMTKIVRGRIKDHAWVDQQTLFEVPDSLKVTGGNRWGGRLFFDKAGYLYFSIGDMARANDSQDLSKPSGKVFRISSDGSIPKDNPFVKTPKALAAIYTTGNRNVQGFSINPATGVIWMTEHGPMGGDEVNIMKKGANYGWPVITYGIDYSGEIVSNETKKAGMEQPVTQWTPSIAVCPAEFVSSKLFTKWNNDLLVGALAFEEVRRLTISNSSVGEQEVILKGVGRVRDIKFGPDGALYVLLNNPDVVLRMTPAQ